jgi:hypothetical protein
MAIPLNAKRFVAEMDPTDIVDYVAQMGSGSNPLLESGESIDTYTLALGAEATALGLTIGADDYAPVLNGADLKFWLSVDEEYQTNPAYDGAGAQLPLILTVITDNTPPRRRQRTMVVTVAQQ